MKKILMILHGDEFPESAMRFISFLNERSPVFVTALVLPRIPRIKNWAAYSATSAGNLKDTSAQENATIFWKRCDTHHIAFSVRMGTTEPGLPQIIKETRFADLLVTSDHMLYTEEGTTALQGLRKVMHQAECPVLVVPENMSRPEQIMIAYDGSESSMFAIKQFAYLFPELRSMEATVVHMDKEGINMPYREQIEQWIKAYFTRCSLVTVNYDAAQYFSVEANQCSTLVVTGSFGRPTLSQWIHPSFADKLISEYHVPVFSSHKS